MAVIVACYDCGRKLTMIEKDEYKGYCAICSIFPCR